MGVGLPGLLGMMSVRMVEWWFHIVVVVMLWYGRRLFPICCGLVMVGVWGFCERKRCGKVWVWWVCVVGGDMV